MWVVTDKPERVRMRRAGEGGVYRYLGFGLGWGEPFGS